MNTNGCSLCSVYDLHYWNWKQTVLFMLGESIVITTWHCYGVKGFSGCKTRIPVNDLKWWSPCQPWPILQTKEPTTNVCPIEPENSRVQKQNLWSLLYLALIFTLKKKKIKVWSKTNDLTWKNPIYFCNQMLLHSAIQIEGNKNIIN